MLKVGLTGGIGSGKTTVARIFESFGVPVYYSDDWAKYLMNHDPELKDKIISLFGVESYVNNELNRGHIASVVFSDKDKLQSLNKVVHPVVRNHFDEWCAKQDSPFVIKEAAILIESGAYKNVDKIIVVSASEKERIRRVVARDSANADQVLNRMRNQLSEEERLDHADFVINNEGDVMLIPQIKEVFETISQQ